METQRAESTEAMEIAITGSSGLIGSALAASLGGAGHRVRPIVRRAPSGPDEIGVDALDLTGVDAVVNLAGAGIGEKRWTPEQKEKILSSRVTTTSKVAAAVVRDGVPALVSGSAIGVYGDRGDEVLTEESSVGDGFLAHVATQWEEAAQPAAQAGARVALLRTGIVLTPRGGALKQMLPLFKLGLGGRMGTGAQWMSWITLDDEVRGIEFLLTSDVRGPVDLTAPHPVRQRDFAKALGRALHRPAVLPTPSFGPRLLLGRELADTLLNESERVLPAVLQSSGFTHSHPDLDTALRAILPSRPQTSSR